MVEEGCPRYLRSLGVKNTKNLHTKTRFEKRSSTACDNRHWEWKNFYQRGRGSEPDDREHGSRSSGREHEGGKDGFEPRRRWDNYT